ncbi:glycosyltransferase family 2 protein [Ferruginibacter albus]|uniref:glycosyltransferase family 2 protein n=1 Tax=Ferruginibacter albus TaxID=2875540 RepID=UPI001CC6F413|nr:glycosyltransferase family 2 protein [Ferruginibacter albus]UAY53126.1 glycosyltransferase family 2 protein [Ferruginibacter albus]
MDISIIFVNYKSPQLVLDCVDSIYEQTKKLSFEIIVVDNFSQDNSHEIVSNKYPAIKWIPMGYNAGFARANNEGIRNATGEYVLILNTDTIILENALDKAVALFEAEKNAVACGIQLLNPDGSQQISGAHFITGGLNILLPLPYFGKLIRFLGYSLKTKVPSVSNVESKTKVDWIIGAFILLRRSTAMQCLMNEDFFMYAEEIEWCSRLRKLGDIYLYADPKVIHIGGGTSSDYYDTTENENSKNLWNRKGRQVVLSNILYIRKTWGICWYLFMMICYLFEIPVFAFCLLIEKIFKGKKAKYKWQNVAGYISNVGILLKYSFKMLVNKPYFYKVA